MLPVFDDMRGRDTTARRRLRCHDDRPTLGGGDVIAVR